MKTQKLVKIIFAITVFLFATRLTTNAQDATSILNDVVAIANKAKTLKITYLITNKKANKEAETFAIDFKRKGEKIFYEFTNPGDAKGAKVLILSTSQIYVYLPAFGKVRRIASNTKGPGFLDMATSETDWILISTLNQFYTATIASQDKKNAILTLAPKTNADGVYSKITMVVDITQKVPTLINCYNGDGKNNRTITFSGYSSNNNVYTAGTWSVKDNLTGTTTNFVIKTVKINEEISDDIFSKRNLE